jgi:hypothetical protein
MCEHLLKGTEENHRNVLLSTGDLQDPLITSNQKQQQECRLCLTEGTVTRACHVPLMKSA